VFLQMASGALVLSILGYISGWTEARSYFETLGALWAASMLSPLRLLQLSTDLISATAFTAIVSIRWAATDAKNAMRVANASCTCYSLGSRWAQYHLYLETGCQPVLVIVLRMRRPSSLLLTLD
jgi:hypothetical protein